MLKKVAVEFFFCVVASYPFFLRRIHFRVQPSSEDISDPGLFHSLLAITTVSSVPSTLLELNKYCWIVADTSVTLTVFYVVFDIHWVI